MDFLEAFECIDTDFSGEITPEELVAFMKKEDYDDKFVQKWMRLFDSDGNGSISIDEYCDILGLVPRDEYLVKVEAFRNKSLPSNQDSPDVNFSSETIDYLEGVRDIMVAKEMLHDTKQLIARLAREGQHKHTNEFEIAKFMKEELDARLEPYWHVIVCRFTHASFVGHEIGCIFHFHLLKFSFFVWKTPYY